MASEIVLHLVAPRQLFVFDPATWDPFDPDALGQSGMDELFQRAQIGWLGTPRQRVMIYVPAASYAPELEQRVRAAFKTHCEDKLAANRREHREFLVMNLFYLALAIVVLIAGLWLQHRLAVSTLIDPGELREAIDTGILVLIWVVVWTPVSGLVLEWVPFARARRTWRLLREAELTVRPEPPRPQPAGRR